MRFEYEITEADYVAAQFLHHRLVGYTRLRRSVPWILAGLVLVVVAINEHDLHWAPLILSCVGGWWTLAGIQSLFWKQQFRRLYLKSGVAGKKYDATVDDVGLEVSGDVCSWRVRWPGVSLKGESADGFIFVGANTIFIFGKKYLSEAQQSNLRKFAAMSTSQDSVAAY